MNQGRLQRTQADIGTWSYRGNPCLSSQTRKAAASKAFVAASLQGGSSLYTRNAFSRRVLPVLTLRLDFVFCATGGIFLGDGNAHAPSPDALNVAYA